MLRHRSLVEKFITGNAYDLHNRWRCFGSHGLGYTEFVIVVDLEEVVG
jgi:hypothetical protein